MCGINGISAEAKESIACMTSATSHRGPDATGYFVAPNISLGHNRLSIIDLSPEANQPMHSPDGRFVLVFNGEIYNYKELRSELTAWQFKTQSDSEVLLAGYATWGRAVLEKLNGIFAFAIWDAKAEELLLARDHMGVKPLYYSFHQDTLFFSSELSGMIAGTDRRILSKPALTSLVTLNYVPSPDSFVEGIAKLRPAHLLSYKNKQVEIRRYWHPTKPCTSRVEYSVLRSTVDQAVQRQLISDRPIGVLLSGGFDSSIVLHHAAQHVEKPRTFSVNFEMISGAEEEALKFNADAELAARTAAVYGAYHKTYTITLDEIRNNLEAAFLALDEPIANPTLISRYLLSRFVRQDGVIVALGGDGGDELFGGYTRHRIAYGAFWFQKLPQLIRRAGGLLHPQVGKLNIPFGTPLYMQLMYLKPDKYKHVFRESIDPKTVADMIDARFQESHISALHPVDQFMRVDRELWLADESLAQSDRTSMAHGLELRVPWLDMEVVRYADALAGSQKFTPFVNKKIIRDAYRGHLPEYLFNQPKRGWISPAAKWLRDPVIRSFAEEVLSPGYYNGLNTLVDWEVVKKMLRDHIEKKSYHLYPLWNLLALQVWVRKYKITI